MNSNVMKIRLEPSLNRCYVITVFPSGIPVTIGVKHHKKTTALQFELDQNNQAIKDSNFTTRMFRNLDRCMFCKTFLYLQSEKTETKDFQYKFSGYNRRFERDLLQCAKEKSDLTVGDPNRPANNYLLIMGFKIIGIEDDFLYYFIQRKCYGHVNKTQMLRTVGLQFATERGYRTLESYYNKGTNEFKKVSNVKFTYDENPTTKVEENIDNDLISISSEKSLIGDESQDGE